MEDRGYRKLNVYKKADELAVFVYKISRKFPRDEIFGLTSQMRRAAVSVVANIVEGYGRRTMNEKIYFYYIARGSLNEIEYYIDLTLNLEYISEAEHKNLCGLRGDVGKLLNGLIKSIQ